MREILFRGKRVDNGEWVEGHLYKTTYEGFNHSLIFKPNQESIKVDGEFAIAFMANEVFVVNPETVGQFIGLPDKNGKRIFEGDLLKLTYDGHSFNCEVKFKDGGFLVCHNNAFNGGDSDMTLVGWLKHDDYSFEITGNIHDSLHNPTPH